MGKTEAFLWLDCGVYGGNSWPKSEKMCSGWMGGEQCGLCHWSSFVPESV